MTEERILLIQLRQLGDILLTTPCLRVIRRERPKARLTFLSHSMGQLILDQCLISMSIFSMVMTSAVNDKDGF